MFLCLFDGGIGEREYEEEGKKREMETLNDFHFDISFPVPFPP